jgi:hypothetical protein
LTTEGALIRPVGRSQVKVHLIAQGFDPTIGLSHSADKYRDALVLDRMDLLRPIIDGIILKFLWIIYRRVILQLPMEEFADLIRNSRERL